MAQTVKKLPTKSVKTGSAKKTATKNKKRAVIASNDVVRKRKIPKYKSFTLSRKIPHPEGPLPSTFIIMRKAKKLIFSNKKALFLLVLVYAVLYMVFVRGFTSPVNISSISESLKSSLGTTASKATLTSAVFASLLGSSGSTNSEVAGLYQGILLLVFSLAVVWIFRQFAVGNKPKVKTALYMGMYPLVPFLLVVAVMGLQLIPVFIASFLFSVVITGGIAATGLEQGLWYVLLGGLVLLSFYMLCSSVFALYVVTLPEMTPMRALRSARQLVFSRRLSIMLKILVLPVLMLLVLAIIVIPTIYFVPVIAPWVYFSLTLAGLVYFHAYMFTIYRELL